VREREEVAEGAEVGVGERVAEGAGETIEFPEEERGVGEAE